MNPVLLILKLVNIILINYFILFVLTILALFSNNYNDAQFSNSLLFLLNFPTIILSSYYQFFKKNKTTDFSQIPIKINSPNVNMGIIGAIFTCFYLDLGMLMDITNLGLSGVHLTWYFVLYDLVVAGSLGMMLSDLFSYANKLPSTNND